MDDITGYYAFLIPDKSSGTVGVVFPDHPGVVTYGNDREHALEMAAEALNASLESEYDRNRPLPAARKKPKAQKGREAVFIELDPEIRTAFLVRSWREKSGLSQAQMARRMGISTQAYQRMERPGRSNLTVATLSRITAALGKQLIVEAR